MITLAYSEEFAGSETNLAIEIGEDTNLTNIAYHLRKFLVAAGYTYVTEVQIKTVGGNDVSSNDDL